MENENEIENIYEFDYVNQNFENNLKYQKWKKAMIGKYGNNIKIFKCKKDRILFFIKDYELKKNIPYFKKCPKCKNLICYFCSYSSFEYNYIFCCLKREISIYSDNSSASAKKDLNENLFDFISFLIPGLNFVGIFMISYNVAYSDLATKKSKNNNGKLKGPNLDNNKKYLIIVYGIAFLLGLVYFIFNAFLIIFTLFISFPFKFYPLKYIYYFG